MAVQKSKVSRSRRGARRSHNKLKSPALSIDQTHWRGALTSPHDRRWFLQGEKGHGSKN